jgi:hypothetical protein
MALTKMIAACVAALALSMGSAVAQDVPPSWLKKPTAQDLLGVWPSAALKSGEGGKAVIECIVTLQGALRACTPIWETPPGAGFGAAGVTLSAQFLMKPGTHNGQPAEATVKIPINWAGTVRGSGSRVKQPIGRNLDTDKVVSSIRWIQAPSFSDVLAAYPEKARAEKTNGRATLDCSFTRTGTLTHCNVLQETPGLFGFGAAARRLAPKFVGPITDGKGASLYGARVQLPFVFAAESLSATSPVIGRPQWAAIPSGDELMAAYPSDAAKAGVLKARVVLSCQVIADGALSGCAVASEDPVGHGIGKATLALSPTFRLGIWTPEGLPSIGGTVRVPIRYDITDKDGPAKP